MAKCAHLTYSAINVPTESADGTYVVVHPASGTVAYADREWSLDDKNLPPEIARRALLATRDMIMCAAGNSHQHGQPT